DTVGDLERGQLASDGDVGDEVVPSDAADRGNGRLRVRELGGDRAGERHLDVGVFRFKIEADEAPVLHDEVVFVAELVRSPVQVRIHRQAEPVADAVEAEAG